MGNKPAKQEKDELLLKFPPPVDPAFARWLARDIQRVEGYTVKNSQSLKPPDHYIEFMHLNGWLDLDLDDPDLAHLFK
ncbi:uncharacterized protein LOC110698608 isoform X2 [Chenopodium quinoa]|uniref:Uncharacterized protein n=1 Tax=Chenopodium quinoa TaxID=63459 RepID=A0A803LE59_CHEQI|nr:uncharacterized protein LOC110698608 isoform X2 [Chenopodium quinoa]